jgi:tRNA threonylcarbamoyladenosine biosynthesis protein TsaE
MKIFIENKSQLSTAVKKLLKFAGEKKIFAFYGSLGAGKTTIIKAVCKVLDVTDIVTSPTFTLVNEYKTSGGDPIYHIDFYRIKKKEEVFDFGVEDYLSGDSYCFIEWPELVEDVLPTGIVRIRITTEENEQRTLLVS